MFMYVRMRVGVYLHEDGSALNDNSAQHWPVNDKDIEMAFVFGFFRCIGGGKRGGGGGC